MSTYLNRKEYVYGVGLFSGTWGQTPTSIIETGTWWGHWCLNEDLGGISRERLKDESAGDGVGFYQTVNLGNFQVDVKPFNELFRTGNSDHFIYGCFNSRSLSTYNDGSNTVYRWSHTPAANIDTNHMVIATKMKDSNPLVIHTYPTCKVDSIKISGESGDRLFLEAGVIPSHLVVSTLQGANAATSAAFNNLTFPSSTLSNKVVPFNTGCTIWMADYDAGTFTDSDKICVSSFEFNFSRGLEIYSCAGDGSTGIDSALVEEPTGGNYPECSVVLEFPRKSNDNNIVDMLNGNFKKLKLQWNAAVNGTTTSEGIELYFPKLDIENVDTASDGLGKIMEPLQMFAYVSNVASSAMPNVDKPLTIVTKSTINHNS